MTTQEQIAVMQAYADGKKIQWSSPVAPTAWRDTDEPVWNWGVVEYRVKPEPIEFLKQELCSRLPYGVKIRIAIPFLEESDYPIEVLSEIDLKTDRINNTSILIDNVKPYLRPMSSMTEEEYECFVDILKRSMVRHKCYDWHEQWIQTPLLEEWLKAHHFDYRGLIPMGLAVRVTEENNPYKD